MPMLQTPPVFDHNPDKHLQHLAVPTFLTNTRHINISLCMGFEKRDLMLHHLPQGIVHAAQPKALIPEVFHPMQKKE